MNGLNKARINGRKPTLKTILDAQQATPLTAHEQSVFASGLFYSVDAGKSASHFIETVKFDTLSAATKFAQEYVHNNYDAEHPGVWAIIRNICSGQEIRQYNVRKGKVSRTY